MARSAPAKRFIRSHLSASRIEKRAGNKIPAGSLDGLTLFRFAHSHRRRSAGGLEGYLEMLNQHLLERNEMRILQMYLAPTSEPSEVEIQKVGRGEIVWIPSYISKATLLELPRTQQIWMKLKKRLLYASQINHSTLLKTLEYYTIGLAVFHWVSEDSILVLKYLNRRKIPFVLINHFQNTRLTFRLEKKFASKARAIGGVSNVDVPDYVKTKFTNVSDGIDTQFFQPEKAAQLERPVDKPLLLLPSRILEGKGHLDAVQALGCLVRRGLTPTLAFAGRVESATLLNRLRELSIEEGVENRVIFLGELKAEDLRNWYHASDLVLLTTYSEGLGRVLLEAQAMKKAVVAYDVGGVVEAVEHGESGYLLERGDVQGLAERLGELLEHDERRHEMGCHGRTYVISRFSIETMVARHENFYIRAMTPLSD